MTIFRAGMAVVCVFIGGIAALLGAVVLISGLSSGTLSLSWGVGAAAASQVVTRASDPQHFAMLLGLLGGGPLVLGALAAWWGWRTLRG